ncbi:MAG: ABC transporter substrate-binding protein, partial [Actinomycetes bacterium]
MNKNMFKKGSTRRNTAILASAVAMLGALTFAPAQAAQTVKIGVLTDMTGAFGIVGKSNKAVAQFTIDEINKSGGVLGRKLEMVLADSATDPAVATQVASKLV